MIVRMSGLTRKGWPSRKPDCSKIVLALETGVQTVTGEKEREMKTEMEARARRRPEGSKKWK